MKSLAWIALGSLLAITPVLACSSTTVTTSNDDDDDAVDSGPRGSIAAGDLGAACGGGTSPGDIVEYPNEECATGVCVVDAREGRDILRDRLAYCSAHCDNADCPSGWACEETTVGAAVRVCVVDPLDRDLDPDPVAGDAGTDAATDVGVLDRKLEAYAANGGKTTSSLRDFQDADASAHDLILVSIDGLWGAYEDQLFVSLDAIADARLLHVAVLVEGPQANQAATSPNLTTWHAAHPEVASLLDPSLATYSEIFESYVALPSFYVLDARNLEILGSGVGASQDTLEDAIAAARDQL